MQGIDAAYNLSGFAGKLKDAGIGFVGRYYSYRSGKDLSPAEAKVLTDAGILIVSVWEARGDLFASFNPVQGQKDAETALFLAQSCGQPEGSAIYFAVDFDASEDELTHGIIPYFQAVNGVLHGKYAVGDYGSGRVCGRLFAAGLVSRLWLAQSQGWAGTAGFEGAHIVQGPEDHSLLRDPVDTDESTSEDFGGWMVGQETRPIVIGTLPTVPRDQDIMATIAALQRQLQAKGFYKGKVDGIAGPLTNAALIAWENAG